MASQLGPPARWTRSAALPFVLMALFLLWSASSSFALQGGTPVEGSWRNAMNINREVAGPRRRRLMTGWLVKKAFFMKTPDMLLTERSRVARGMAAGSDYSSRYLYSVIFVAGKHTAELPSTIDTTMEDIMVAFFRLFNVETLSFPHQWYAINSSLERAYTHAMQAAMRQHVAEQNDYNEDPDREKPLELSVPELTWMVGQQLRDIHWLFDGNTFHQRGNPVVPDVLTDRHLGFLRSLPYNVLRIAHGIMRDEPTTSVAFLIEELRKRGITTIAKFLNQTNFLDLLMMTSVLDETFTQIDIINEYVENWKVFRDGKVSPPSIPLGNGREKLLETLQSKKTDKNQYPKCPTMICYVESVWTARAEHPIDSDKNQQQQEEEEDKKPKTANFNELLVKKTDSNALKVVAIGNTGHDEYPKFGGFRKKLKDFFRFNEFEALVSGLKTWHEREGADIALGLGDFLRSPGMLSVSDSSYAQKWEDIFVKEAKLDIPWYMVNGEAEQIVSHSAPYRYHYTGKSVNYHNPAPLNKSVVTVVANLTTAEGGADDQEFKVHIITINTWALFGGTPFYDNMYSYTDNLVALSNALFHSAKAKADWIIVQGHHPLLGTGPEAEEARFQYIDDMFKNGRPRGPEHRIIELLTAYQVDAYISAHDHVMEFTTMTDTDKNSTLAFISSGGGTRIFSSHMGRGWLGKVRGKLFPVLCWSGRKLFYQLDPGGCRPSEKDQALAYKFYAPQGNNWKISVKERVMDATGFASLKISKDFLVVNFINSRTGKPTGRRLHKQTNREARAAKFVDYWEDAKLKLEELKLDHEAFEEENRELVASEIAFQRRTPILAERVRFLEHELNEMYDEYQSLKQKKAFFETMSPQKIAALEAQGENFNESELSDGMYEQTERIIELMYTIAADHAYLWSRYENLKAQRKILPEKDTKHAEGLLKLEKQFASVRKQRREISKKCLEGGGGPRGSDADQIKELSLKAKIIRRDIKALDEEDAKDSGSTQDPVEQQGDENSSRLEIKPIDMSAEGRLERKKKQLEDHEKTLEKIQQLSQKDREKLGGKIAILERQHEKLKEDVKRLESLLERKESVSDRRPSELWEKMLQRREYENTLQQLSAYRQSIKHLPKVHLRTQDMGDALTNIEFQMMDIRDRLSELAEELHGVEQSEMQTQLLDRMANLHEVNMLLESKVTMPPDVLGDPEIQRTLANAEAMQKVLQSEVESLDESVRKQLTLDDEVWARRMILEGRDAKELAEEFSFDIEAIHAEDERERREDPEKQVKWVERQIQKVESQIGAIEQLPESERAQRASELEQLNTRKDELIELKGKAEEMRSNISSVKQMSDLVSVLEDAENVVGKVAPLETGLFEQDGKIFEDDQEPNSRASEDVLHGSPYLQNSEEEPFWDADDVVEQGLKLDTLKVQPSSNLGAAALSLEDEEDDEEEIIRSGHTPVEGSSKRRLASLMEMFQPKREETPVKELQKIDLGPKDPCDGDPMLYVVVKKEINAQFGASFEERCTKVFANRSHRMQRRFIGLFDDTGSGVSPALYDKPHAHVVQAFKSLYGITKMSSLRRILSEVKEGLLKIGEAIKRSTFEEASSEDAKNADNATASVGQVFEVEEEDAR